MDYAVVVLFGVLVVVAASALAPRLGVATPLILVVIGIACSLLPGFPPIEVEPELILALVLPPILYAAAVNVPLVDFRRNLKPIAGLSILLVIVSAIGSGLLFYWLLPGLGLAAAIALGAVISPTDAVAATSLGKRLGLPPRLVTVMEGEGLVNDASALVLLRSAIAATAGVVSLWEIVGNFAYAVAVAVVVGVAIGYATVWVRSKFDNSVLNTTVSFAVPFLAYLPAEKLNASGVLAVVAAGLVTGHQSAKYFTAQDRISERINWRTIQFVLENGVFLLIGLELKALVEDVTEKHLGVLPAIGMGLAAAGLLLVIRVAFVVPLIGVLRHDQRRAATIGQRLDVAMERLKRADSSERAGGRTMSDNQKARVHRFFTRKRADYKSLAAEGLGWRGGAVLAWSGMRGVVTLAAAQSLPHSIPYRSQLVLIAFTVAIVTVLVQGATLPFLITRLHIVGTDAVTDRAELADLLDEISSVGLATLDNPGLIQDNGEQFDPAVIERVRAEGKFLTESIMELPEAESAGPHRQSRALRLAMLRAERAALLDARSTGSHTSRALGRAQAMLDLEESRLAQLDEEP
ncbi:sodium:proton antiporter [Homoserinimonas sp. OAct 916]|uniref:cation:proton antiporter n=1 Tax=Homoserinimonas sp. OAct 916 TaxID=2211450 RepID=UPI000DBE9520|nr:sodium:proton antiporter [Homoserinimonas sp. OAct 916]